MTSRTSFSAILKRLNSGIEDLKDSDFNFEFFVAAAAIITLAGYIIEESLQARMSL